MMGLVGSAWTFGWEALVALGTLGLAGATAFLAWLTRRVAAASAADVRAQWRPVLLPGEGPVVVAASRDGVKVPIRNAGRGPALFVRTTLDPLGASPENWSLGAVAPGDEVELTFRNVHVSGPHYQVLLDYRDISSRMFSTAIVLDLQGTPPRFYDVHVYEDHRVTHHGDSVPQAGLAVTDPAPPIRLPDRLRAAWEAFLSGGR